VCLAVFLVSLAGALKNLGDIGPRTLLMMSSGVWMLAGSIIVVVLLTRRRFAAAFTAQTLTVLVTCVAALGLAAKTGAATTEDQLAQIVADGPQPAGLQVAMQRHFEDHSSFGFYLPRSAFPLHIVQGRWGGDLQFGSSREPELFLSQDQFRTWASSRPVYLLTESPPKLSVPQGFHVAGRQNQAMLWANFPKMKGGGWVARPQDAGYPS